MKSLIVYRSAEPPEKRQKFLTGWTRRAVTKTTRSRDLLVLLLVVGCLQMAQRPPEGAKTSEIPDRLRLPMKFMYIDPTLYILVDPPRRQQNVRNSGPGGPAETPKKQEKVGICWFCYWLLLVLPANGQEAP